jgi:hypothetical protein
MPCCGKARLQVPRTITNQRTSAGPGEAPQPPQPASGQSVYFRYFGQTGLTVTGPASSRVYRFAANGGPIAVDARDAASLARVPNLRAVRQV